jgi:hypothetical protein
MTEGVVRIERHLFGLSAMFSSELIIRFPFELLL